MIHTLIIQLTPSEEKFYSTITIAEELFNEGNHALAQLCIRAAEHEAVRAENFELAAEFRDVAHKFTA